MRGPFLVALFLAVLLLAVVFLPGPAATGSEWNSPRAGNPVLPGYFADPCCRKFGDTYYIYATPDGWDVGKGPFCIWSSKDFVHWTAHESKWPSTDFKWAPSVIERGGRYFMYNSVPCQVWAAVADSPLGPFNSLMDPGKPFIPDQTPKGTITLDGEVFVDDDGRIYLYYGTWGTFTAVELNPDMRSFKGPPIQYFGEAGKKNGTAPDWFEAPYMFQRKGLYYMMYSCAFCQDSSYNVKYVTARSPLGPWTFDPSRNPILETSDDGTVDGPGHHTILEDRGRVFIVYHRHDNPHHPDGAHRQTCADELRFDADGAIEKVVPSHAGIGFLAPSTKRDTDVALGNAATASSSAGEDFRPEHAVDQNRGTLWKAAGYVYPQWLRVDLGKDERVRRAETEFQFAQVRYRYLIECSRDGAAWETFADRRANESWGPMVDPGDATARYFRITILGDDAPHRPAPEIAIWNFKLYDGIDKPNRAPEVDAGPDGSGTARFLTRVVEGSVHDDGLPHGPVSVRWSRVDGPGPVTFEHPDRVRSKVTFETAGKYILRLEASDGELTGSDTVPIEILPPGDTLIRYDFDEKGGNVSRDSSGNGQDGVLRGGALRCYGMHGNAVQLDGRDDFVSCPPLGDLDALTIAAWIDVHTIEGDSAILSGGGPGAPGLGALAAIAGTGELRFAAPGLEPRASSFRFRPEDLGEWRHVAIAWDSTSKTVAFYIDGRLGSSAYCDGAPPLRLKEPLRIGGSAAGVRGLHGEVDEFRLYAKALSSSEVAELARSPGLTAIGDALKLADGEPVTLLSKTISFAPKDPMTMVRTTRYFYLAERDGSAGVRVECGPGVEDKAIEDRCASLAGVLRTRAGGERYVEIASPPSIGGPRAAVVRAPGAEPSVASTLAAAPPAALVRVTGKVARVAEGGRDFFVSADGRETRVVVEKGPIVKRIAAGDTVDVTGVVARGAGEADAILLLRDMVRTDPPPAPILAHYAFDEEGGDVARDATPNGLDARLVNGPRRTAGKLGRAIELDGKSSHVRLPDLGIQTAVTVASWIRMNRLGRDDWATSILHTDGWEWGDLHFMVQVKKGVLQVSVNGANPGALESKFSFAGNLGRWVHVATTYDTTSRRFALYVDGKEEASAVCGEMRPIDLTSASIGAWGDRARMLDGALDDFRIHDRALSAEEIAAIAGGAKDGEDVPPSPERGFRSTRPAGTWEEALICGNGKHGAMVLGRPLEETIIINHAGLWLPLEAPLPPVDTASHLAEIREILRRGEYQRAADLVVELSHRGGWGGKRWTDPLVPAFDLEVTLPPAGEVRSYARTVDFATGVAAVRWDDDRGRFLRRAFVSRADDVVALSIRGPSRLDCTLRLARRPVEGQGGWWPEAIFKDGIAGVAIDAEDGWLTYRSAFRRRWPGSLQGYEGVARVVPRGGTARAEGGAVVVSGADEIVVLLRVAVLRDLETSALGGLKASLGAIDPDFDELLGRHAEVHGGIFLRSRLDLGGGAARDLPSEELLAASSVGSLSRALLEKEYDAGRYAILSSSGELYPTLQGLWNGTWSPPWSSDFTLNGNVQCAIAADLSSDMAECLEPFLRYLEAQMPQYRENARRLYGCRGIHVPSRASSHGLNNHFDATWPMTFWTAGAAWAARSFYDRYLHDGDRDFLRDRALPFMKEAALFYEDFLVEGPDGKLAFIPSYSPENNPRNEPSQACVDATMDVAAARELLQSCIAACETLGTDAGSVGKWKGMLSRLPAYRINADGAAAEWVAPSLEDNYEHRHCSHLYPLFDGLPDEIARDEGLRRAFRRAIELRMEVRRREGGGIMAFGLVQLGLAAASLREADLAYEALDWLANRFWRANLVSTHDPGALFNVDLCGGLPALVNRMLVDSRPGWVELLPALPRQWPSGRIEGLRCRGGVAVRLLEWDGERVDVTLRSGAAQELELRIPGGIATVEVASGGASFAGAGSSAGSQRVRLPAGEDIALRLGRARPASGPATDGTR